MTIRSSRSGVALSWVCWPESGDSESPRQSRLWRKTKFETEPPSSDDLRLAKRQLNDSLIVELWAALERTIVEHIQRAARIDASGPFADLKRAIQIAVDKSIEQGWPTTDKIKLYQWLVGERPIGQVIQIKNYRDWLAHNNPDRKPAGTIASDHAYRVLSFVLQSIHGAV